jgi:hypothetical protein
MSYCVYKCPKLFWTIISCIILIIAAIITVTMWIGSKKNVVNAATWVFTSRLILAGMIPALVVVSVQQVYSQVMHNKSKIVVDPKTAAEVPPTFKSGY